MSDILDEHLTAELERKQCKRARAYTLFVAGIMACIALFLRLIGGSGEHYFIIAGMLAITFHAHYCFFKKQRKNWFDLAHVILITMITGLAFIYYMLPELLYY